MAAIGVAPLMAVVGCATPAMRAPGVEIVPRRLIATPTVGVVWQWGAGGKATVFPEGSAAAMKNVDASISYRLGLMGGRTIAKTAFEEYEWAASFRAWSEGMMTEIMAERLGRTAVKHESVADWRYQPTLAAWRDRLAADFLLVSMFLDGSDTTGRSLMVAFRGYGYVAAQRAIACVVRMDDGRVVWCNLIDFGFSPLRAFGAQEIADQLLVDMPAIGVPPTASGATAPGQP